MANKVNAFPAKRFFVNMLTRDIDLIDSILDLLDNCIDGVLRSLDTVTGDKPYEGYSAEISFSEDRFVIKDNCGGIPRDVAEEYAFRMGRPAPESDVNKPTVGMYGIGMKRAIFKMGQSSRVISHTGTEAFEVAITSAWLKDDDNWTLYLNEIEIPDTLSEPGTLIEVTSLYPGIERSFSPNSKLNEDLYTAVSQHYSLILEKGFSVLVNGEAVKPRKFNLLWNGPDALSRAGSIAPYVYKSVFDGVEIEMAVGFYTAPPSADEVEDDQLGNLRRTDNAGWTIVCNDRVVLYADRSRLTGWGDAGVPNYHTQFIAIAGVVNFKSTSDPLKLPVTTTKRGLDANSDIYLYAKKFMRIGLKKFTSYTNLWKKRGDEERKYSGASKKVDVKDLFEQIPSSAWQVMKSGGKEPITEEMKIEPDLPKPSEKNPTRQIRFMRSLADIERVAERLFGETDVSPHDVGGACFDHILEKA